MKCLIDAQLPRRLAWTLREQGHDVLHTLDLPEGNRTSDSTINQISIDQQRVVITKDNDFIDSLLVSDRPYKLLLVTTGNIVNDALIDLFSTHLSEITKAFEDARCIELSAVSLTIRS